MGCASSVVLDAPDRRSWGFSDALAWYYSGMPNEHDNDDDDDAIGDATTTTPTTTATTGADDLLTTKEAAVVAGRDVRTVQRWVDQGRLSAQRDNRRRWLVRRGDVERLRDAGDADDDTTTLDLVRVGTAFQEPVDASRELQAQAWTQELTAYQEQLATLTTTLTTLAESNRQLTETTAQLVAENERLRQRLEAIQAETSRREQAATTPSAPASAPQRSRRGLLTRLADWMRG